MTPPVATSPNPELGSVVAEDLGSILTFGRPVALIGGGEAAQDDVDAVIARAGAVIAADGGANRFEPGAAPRVDAVIGDMDSIDDLARWRAEPGCRVIELAEQETTDLEKCLYSVEAPLYLGVGFFGARLDHTLAALNLLAKRPDRRVLLVGRDDVCFLTPLDWSATLWPGARVSVFPLPAARAVSSAGLRWPIDGLDFTLGGAIGTSNEAVAGAVAARFETRTAAILFERRALDAAIACLTG